jgi:hypothetical protein
MLTELHLGECFLFTRMSHLWQFKVVLGLYDTAILKQIFLLQIKSNTKGKERESIHDEQV